MHVNLLPESIQWRVRLRSSLRQWLIVWAALGILALPLGAWKFREVVAQGTHLAALEEQSQPLRAVESQITEQAQRLSALQVESAVLQDLAQNRQVLGLLGIVARCAKQKHGKLQVQRFGFQATPLPPAVGPGAGAALSQDVAKNAAELASLHLHGVAGDDVEVARFISGLQQSLMFQQVELKSCSDFGGSSGGGRQFQVECRF